METPVEKGNKLEEAVELIEGAILATDPSLKGTLVIERKKIITKPVRHEIDLYVTIDHGHDYKSVFIFECKNWELDVTKNEIIIFSEKIKAVNATMGFFVAKSYTKEALNQAMLDPKIKILYAKHNPIDFSPFPTLEVVVFSIPQISELNLLTSGVSDISEAKKLYFNVHDNLINYKGEKKKLLEFIDKFVKEACDEKYLDEKKDKIFDLDLEYELEGEKQISFNENELFLENTEVKEKDIRKISFKFKFKFKHTIPRVITKIDIFSRGSFIEYEPVKVGENEIKLAMVFSLLS